MRKNVWKRVLAAGCIATLLITLSGIMVFASESRMNDVILSDNSESDSNMSTLQEQKNIVYGVDDKENSAYDKEDEFVDNIDIAESSISSVDYLEEDLLEIATHENSSEIEGQVIEQEHTVGNANITVGDGVTATFDAATGAAVLYSNEGTLWNNWRNYISGEIMSIKVASGIIYLPVDSRGIFSNLKYITDLDLRQFNTSNVTNMSNMFCGCSNLTELNMQGFNTSKVKTMSGMFSDCSSLSIIDLSSFDTSNVEDLGRMFSGCNRLKALDLSTFETKKLTNMAGMFFQCRSLTDIDLSGFDTSRVTNMSNVFQHCEKLTTLNLCSFNTSQVTSMHYMFLGCYKLKTVDLSNFDTSKVLSMNGMFSGCYSIECLDLNSFDMTFVADVEYMLSSCTGLRDLRTPINNKCSVELPFVMCDESGNSYEELPDISESILLKRTININEISITYANEIRYYSGKAYMPEVTLKKGSTALTKDIDYLVEYKDNIDSGYATILITGIGYYTGTAKRSFYIHPAIPKLTFAKGSIIKTTLDEEFINELTKPTEVIPFYSSKNKDVAIIDSSNGKVTIKGEGTTIITASCNPTKNYKSSATYYTLTVTAASIDKASVEGVSLSYGYSGKAYTPVKNVKVNGIILKEGMDYTINYKNNINPGTATITLTGIGKYTGTRVKTFEIMDCVSKLVSGKTYQLIPKNNSSTAVCSFSGRMVNNTKVYITDRSNSEAMKFKAVKNSDGTWKFINAKCEMSLAVQQNSSAAGKGLVLYDQTTKKAQNWKLTRKSDNSFAITNAVSGLYIAMSDMSAPKGTTLSIKENSGRGDQRFYIVETSAVSAPFDGTCAVKASKNKAYGLNIASSSKTDGANVNLYKYSNTNSKKFKIMYSGGGYYRLVNVNSGLVLTVKGNTKANGANVIQSKWAAQSGQRWKITKNSNGTVTLKNALGTVLHLNGNKTANGTNVVARNASTTGAQKWYLG